MRVTTLLRKLLCVTSLSVRGARFEIEGLVVEVRPRWRRARCGQCGKPGPVYLTATDTGGAELGCTSADFEAESLACIPRREMEGGPHCDASSHVHRGAIRRVLYRAGKCQAWRWQPASMIEPYLLCARDSQEMIRLCASRLYEMVRQPKSRAAHQFRHGQPLLAPATVSAYLWLRSASRRAGPGRLGPLRQTWSGEPSAPCRAL